MKNKQHSQFKKIVLGHLAKVKGSLFTAALCMIGYTLAEILSPWPLKIIFDYILIESQIPEHHSFLDPILEEGRFFALMVVSGSILVIAIFRSVFAYFQIFITSRIGFQLVYTLRLELFAHLQRLSLSFHSRTKSGELLTKVTGDTKILRDVYSETVLAFISHFMIIIGVFVVMFFMSWKLALISLLPFPILLYILFFLFKKIKKTAKKQRKKEGKVASRLNELLAIIPLVQSHAQEDYETERFETESKGTLKQSIQITRMVAATTRAVELVSASGVFAVVFFGSLQVIDGALTPGDLLLFSSYVKKLFSPVKRIAKLSSKFSKAMASADRIEVLLEIEPEIQDVPDAIVVKKLKGEIEFKNVSFSYDDGRTILDKVSFKVSPGQRVALVGGSGAGKSTITKLLLRLYDFQEGEILIDGIDIRKFKRDALRREIGIVLQEAILLGTTIRENITYGNPEASQEELEAAAHYAHADEFIDRLPDRYETVLGERGGTLSGGQRQRIGLARAIIRKPSILILDEPTSAVDAESSKFIQEAMSQFQRGKTCLVIIHQFEAIQNFDQIIALKNGKVVEKGTHQQLLAGNGYYAELYRLQGSYPRD